MKLSSLILLSVLLIGCANSKSKNRQNEHWQVEGTLNYAESEEVIIEITNISGINLIVHDPMIKNVYRKKDDEKIKVETGYCLCRDCPPPPETRLVPSNESFKVTWDKKEDSCDGSKLLKNDVPSGEYSIEISYSMNNKFDTFSIEFSI